MILNDHAYKLKYTGREMLVYIYMYTVYTISICISTLPTQHTACMFISLKWSLICCIDINTVNINMLHNYDNNYAAY